MRVTPHKRSEGNRSEVNRSEVNRSEVNRSRVKRSRLEFSIALVVLLTASLSFGCARQAQPTAQDSAATPANSQSATSPEPAATDSQRGEAGSAGRLGSAGTPGNAGTSESAVGVGPAVGEQERGPGGGSAGKTVTAETVRPPLPVPDEQWSVIEIDGGRVGYAHFQSQRREEQGQSLVQLRSMMQMTIKRFGQTVTQEIRLTSLETEDGQVRSCRCEVKAGPVANVTEGEVRDGRMVLKTTTAGKSTTSTLAWQPHYTGFFGAELSPQRKPLEPGETRTVMTLVPLFNQVAEVKLAAGDYESIDLLDSTARLLRVGSLLQIGPNRIESVMWLDDQGRTMKSLMPGIKQVTYLTSREVAMRPAGAVEFDLGTASVVKVDRPLAQPHQTRKIVYRAKLGEGQADGVFVNEGGQQVRKIDDQTVELTVRAVRPDMPAELERPGNPPTRADSAPNNQIQSDNPAVVAMANEVGANEVGSPEPGAPEAGARKDDPWKLARQLESHVSRSIRSKNFSQAFATAAEVVVSREGDCTEHAVLLAALCRARGIPARVAIGLVYYPLAQGFAYHMWNEVWVNERWVPLDATLNQGGIGAAHLKLAHSNLDGADALSAFLPVFRVLGQLDLEIQSVE